MTGVASTTQRLVALSVAISATAVGVVLVASGAARPRAGLWLGLVAVGAVAAGTVLRSAAAVAVGLVALAAQYLVAVVGVSGVDGRAAVLSGVVAIVVEAADWAVEADGCAEAAVVVRRALRMTAWGLAAWLAATVVWAVAGGRVDPVLARAAAVGLLVVVWLVVADALRTGGAR